MRQGCTVRNWSGSNSSWPLLFRMALKPPRMNWSSRTPGISTGCWKERNIPSLARFSGIISNRFLPWNVTLPFLTVYPGLPASRYARVLLPEPLGPIRACTSPAFISRSIPFKISVLLIEMCRLRIVSIKSH